MMPHSSLSRRRLLQAATGSILTCAARPGIVLGQDLPAPWREGDGLRLAGPVSDLASLDPALSRETGANFLLGHLFRGLTAFDASLDPAPELAASIDVSADGVRHGVTLRPDAAFHDGRPVSPTDVVASLTRALDPATAGGRVEGLAAVPFLRDILGADALLAGSATTLAGLAITGDRTLEIVLAQRSPSFLARLASVTAAIVDHQQVAQDPGWALHPNGSGPFALAAWTPGSEMVLEPAATWWSGQPVTGPLAVRLGSGAVQPANLYQAGLLDFVWSIPSELVDLVEDPASGFDYGTLVRVNAFATAYIAFSNQVPPLDDPHLRRALRLAFPASAVADAMYDGTVAPASGLVPPGMHHREWSVVGMEADPDAARDALARSRYGSPGAVPPVQVHAADIRPVEAFREVVEDVLGITIEAVQVPWGAFLEGLTGRRFAAYGLHWTADYPDAESMLDLLFRSSSSDNYTGYASDQVDTLLDRAREASGDARLDLLEEANRLLVEDGALIPLYHDVGHALVRDGIAGVRVTPMGLLGLESIHGEA